MQVQAINNQTNFKAVIKDKDSKFSDKQLSIFTDIRNKIENSRYYKDWDYIAQSKNDDTLDLYQSSLLVDNPPEKSYFIGNYKDNSFELLDLKETSKLDEHKRQCHYLFSFAAFFAVLGCLVAGTMRNAPKSTKIPVETVKEQVVTPVKDTLQKVGKDTLKLTKQLIKK